MAKRSQAIVDDYLRLIATGELTPGTLLPTETAMIEKYGVSRTAVREAVQSLEHRGFIRIRQGSGSTVAPRGSWNVLDADYLAITGLAGGLATSVTEARDILEPPIAGIAATNATSEQVERLRTLAKALDSAEPSKSAWGLDAEFHSLVAEASGNPVLARLHASVLDLTRSTDTGEGVAKPPAAWFAEIVEAIANQDRAAAHDAMRMHLRKDHSAPGF